MGAFYDLDLIINAADPRLSGLLAVGPNNEVTRGIIKIPQTIRGDQLNTRIRLVTPSLSGQRQFDDVDISAATVTAAIGSPDQAPLAGTFALTFTQTTTDISYSASASDVAAALNLLAAVVSVGGITVTSPASGVFYVAFNTVGARSLISGDGSKLLPLSNVSISRSQVGTSGLIEIQTIRVFQNPYCIAQLSTALPSAGYTVTNLQTGDSNNPSIQRLALAPAPYSGTFTFVLGGRTFTAPYSASQSAMQALVTSVATVIQSGQFQWDFMFNVNGAQSAITATAAGLSVPIGVTGTILLNTVGLYQAFYSGSATSLYLLLEIKFQWANSLAETKLQMPINVSRSVIDAGALILSAVTAMNITWIPGLTALTGSSSALDHVAIAGLTTNSLIIAEINGSGELWKVYAGAYDPTDPGQIQTQDYSSVTNNRHLGKIS